MYHQIQNFKKKNKKIDVLSTLCIDVFWMNLGTPCIPLTDWFYYRDGEFLLRGTDRFCKQVTSHFVLKKLNFLNVIWKCGNVAYLTNYDKFLFKQFVVAFLIHLNTKNSHVLLHRFFSYGHQIESKTKNFARHTTYFTSHNKNVLTKTSYSPKDLKFNPRNQIFLHQKLNTIDPQYPCYMFQQSRIL